jgi:hypothetical protein
VGWGGKPTSHRIQNTSEQRFREAERLRVEEGQQVNLQNRAMVDTCALLQGLRVVFKTELPHLAGGGADQKELQL